MAILIKGMEMPDSCFLCRFCRRQEYGEYYCEDTAWSCVASKKRITDGLDLIATFKHPDCPLVEAAEVKDAVSRQAAIDALWKALYIYEDEAKKKFKESKELDIGDWVTHRIFVQNMNDIDRETIQMLPSEQPEIIHCCDCKHRGEKPIADGRYWCEIHDTFMYYCSDAERRTDEESNIS